jgi:hypothetical protein
LQDRPIKDTDYSHSPEINPKGPDKGTKKIMQDFTVLGSPELFILYRRIEHLPESNDGGGIRCVVNLPTPVKNE